MQKRVLFLVLMISFICASSAFAIKGMKKTASKSKISEVSKEDKVTTTEATSKDTTEKKSKKKKDKKTDKKEKKITKIFLPGHDKNNQDLVCQGIAYIPGETMKDGDPRYVLLSYYPNKKVTQAPAQIVVIDREKSEKNKAIKRFSLYREQIVKNNKKNNKTQKVTEEDSNTSGSAKENDTYIFKDPTESTLDKLIEENETDVDDMFDDADFEEAEKKEDDNQSENNSQVASTEKDDDNDDADKEAVGEKDEDEDNDDDDEKNADDKVLVNLPYRGHAGGIAVAGKYLWVASGFTIRGYDLDEIKDFIKDTNTEAKAVDGLPNSMDKLPAKDIFMVKEYKVDSRASFLSYDGKYLWVGDYTRKNSQSCIPVEHHKQFKHYGWVAGYLVDKEGCPTSNNTYSFTYKEKVRTVNKPDVVLAVRRRAQGIAICGKYIALSVSCGPSKSKIEIYQNPLTKYKKNNKDKDGKVLHCISYKVDGNKQIVEGYNLNKKNRVVVISKSLPAQIQDLEYDGKKLYTTFLCNSGKYKENHKDEKILISKNFYIIDFDQMIKKNTVVASTNEGVTKAIFDIVKKFCNANEKYVLGAAHSKKSGYVSTSDCSGFTAQFINKLSELAGVKSVTANSFPRSTTFAESKYTKQVTSKFPPTKPRDLIKPGDIFVMSKREGGHGHVGVFMGYNKAGKPLIAHSTTRVTKKGRVMGKVGHTGVRVEVIPSDYNSKRWMGIYRINNMDEITKKLSK